MADIYWVLANLFIPVFFAPLLLFLPLITGTPWTKVKQYLQASVGDGQLLWAAIGMAATGAYDAGMAAFVEGRGDKKVCLIIMSVFLALAFLSSYVVKDAAIKLRDYEEALQLAYQHQTSLPKKSMGIVVLFSFGVTAITMWIYWNLKFSVAI